MMRIFHLIFMISGFWSVFHYLRLIRQQKFKKNDDVSADSLTDPMIITYLVAGLVMGLSAGYNFIVDSPHILIWGFILFIIDIIIYGIGKSLSEKQKHRIRD